MKPKYKHEIAIVLWIDASQDDNGAIASISESEFPSAITLSSGIIVKEDEERLMIARDCFINDEHEDQVRQRLVIYKRDIKWIKRVKV